MRSLRVFFVGGLISYRALFGWLSPMVFIPSLVVAPVFQILLFAYIGRTTGVGTDEFYVVGNALQYASIPCIFAMTHTISGEREERTLGNVLIAPVGRFPLFLGRALPVIVNGVFVAAFAFAVGGLLLRIDVPVSALAPLAVSITITAFACTGLGLVSAAIGLRVRETAVLSNCIFGILLIFTGANVATENLPGWMSTIGQGLPLTHGIEATRRLADGAMLGDVAGTLAAEAAIGLAYGAAGHLALLWMETVSRRKATLEMA